MSIHIVYFCSGCPREATVNVGANVISVPIGGGIDRVAVEKPRVDESAPDGWIAFDPYTHVTYCPECWDRIENGEPPS